MEEDPEQILVAGVMVLMFIPVFMALLGFNPQPFVRMIPELFIALVVVIGGLALAGAAAAAGGR